MDNINIKPYEISIWEDVLVDEIVHDEVTGEDVPVSYYTERKLAVIGSDTMHGGNAAYSSVFTKNNNGDKTLTFSLKAKYFEPNAGVVVENSFIPLLINERKVKLYYENQWYDFIIKECVEDSESYEYTYTAYDAFVLELSKTGYNVTFNSNLNNNQGTALELVEQTLIDTEWDAVNIDVKPPQVKEPIYNAITKVDLVAYRLDDNKEVPIPNGTEIYVFYSYIVGKNGHFLQFIKKKNPSEYEIDDNNNILETNYRLEGDVIFNEGTIAYANNPDHIIIEYTDIYLDYQAYRTIYQQLSTYDSIMDKIVQEYDADGTRIYSYTDSVYTTSDILVSYIANGSDFNIYDNGTLQGWSQYTEGEHPEINLTTYPEIDPLQSLASLDLLEQLEGYLEVKFPKSHIVTDGIIDDYESMIFNSGIEDNAAIIDHIAEGEEFVFRYKAAASLDKHGDLYQLDGNELGLIVALYNKEYENSLNLKYENIIDPTNIILHFTGQGEELNNVIRGGELIDDDSAYIIDGVIQTPAIRYLYEFNDKLYVYDSDILKYVEAYSDEEGSNYIKYYYLTAAAQRSITKQALQDPTSKIGIFIYTTDAGTSESPVYYYIQDIQLTALFRDKDNNVLTLGNIPKAQATNTEFFYIKPQENTPASKIELYTSKEAIANRLQINPEQIVPIYNRGDIAFATNEIGGHSVLYVDKGIGQELTEQFHVLGYSLDKVLSIEASKSNCFNILQTIAETFECWIKLSVTHDEDGKVHRSKFGHPTKVVELKSYVTKDNFAGFKYGINLNTINRTIDSNEVITKLIVDDVQSDYADTGVVSIQRAISNVSGEGYILNFDYFLNQGLISDVNACKQDLYDYDMQLRECNNKIYEAENSRISLEASLTKLNASRNVYVNLLDAAKDTFNHAIDDFEQLTGYDYETYTTLDDSRYLEIESISKAVGDIYASTSTINNYQGLITNLELEYNDIYRQLYGIKEHLIIISRVYDEEISRWFVRVTVDSYLDEFGFVLNDGDTIYRTNVNQKVFNIRSNATEIVEFQFNNSEETGYKLVNDLDQEITTLTLLPDVVSKIRLVPYNPQDGLVDIVEKNIEEKKEIIHNFNNKYSRFILEGNWSSQDYLDDELYYLDAVQVSNTSAHPQITYDINVAEIGSIEGYEAYKFDVGDKTFVEDPEFFGWNKQNVGTNAHPVYIKTPARESVLVNEISWNLEDPSATTITVQNYKTKFEDLFQRIQATVQTVQYNEATYAKTSSIIDLTGTLNENVLLDSLNAVSGKRYNLTSDGAIIVDGDRLLVRNLTNVQNLIKIDSEGIGVSSDGGLNWSTAISGRGVNVGKVYSGSINTDEIFIGGEDNPSFRWDSNGLSAYELVERIADTDPIYNFSRFVRFDQHGIYGIDLEKANLGNSFVAENIQDVEDKAFFALTWHGFFIRNSYEGGGRVEITSDNDFRVLKSNNNEKIKIGALEWEDEDGNITIDPMQGVGAPTLYGIRIMNDDGEPVMITDDNGDIIITGTINATGGSLGDLDIDHILTVRDSGIIKSSNYSANTQGWKIDSTGAEFNSVTVRGRVEASEGTLGALSVINTVTIGANGGIQSTNYNAANKTGWHIDNNGVFVNNAVIRGAVNAGSGNFYGLVTVGKDENDNTKPYIEIDGVSSEIRSSNYSDGAGAGWMINKDGDAVFNNITARGAIKTAVFEYAEIQAVGGIFLFRPSSTIRKAKIAPNGTDLILEVEKPLLFAKTSGQEYSWCKISNYTSAEIDVQDALTTNGLTYVYQISDVDTDAKEVTLDGGASFITAVQQSGETISDVLIGLEGGALIDMGRGDNSTNYGIGINSSDNTVNLPRRSISLFETAINENEGATLRVTYGYRAILGTLPPLNNVHNIYTNYMYNTQGIYTDNMYIGNADEFIAFYSNGAGKRLEIKSDTIHIGASGYIESAEYIGPQNPNIYAQQGLHIDLETGDITTPNLVVHNGEAYINGTIYAQAGTVGGFTVTNTELKTSTGYTSIYRVGRTYLKQVTSAETGNTYTVAITNPVLSEFKDYDELILVDNGNNNYTYQRVNIAEHIYNRGRDVYKYNNNEFEIYIPTSDYVTLEEFKQALDTVPTGASSTLIELLFERVEYDPFNYNKYPYYNENIMIPFTDGIYISNFTHTKDIDPYQPIQQSVVYYSPSTDFSVYFQSTDYSFVEGTTYYVRSIEGTDEQTILYTIYDTSQAQSGDNPVSLSLYVMTNKTYYRQTLGTENFEEIPKSEYNDGQEYRPVDLEWFERAVTAEGTIIDNYTGIIAGGPVTPMNLTNAERNHGITEQRSAPNWYFKSDGSARIGDLYLSADGTLDIPTLSTVTVDLGVLERGIIKHDPVGFEGGLWISAATNINPDDPNHISRNARQIKEQGGIIVGASGGRLDWRILLSNNFGVTEDGALFASKATISGLTVYDTSNTQQIFKVSNEGEALIGNAIFSGTSTFNNSIVTNGAITLNNGISVNTTNALTSVRTNQFTVDSNNTTINNDVKILLKDEPNTTDSNIYSLLNTYGWTDCLDDRYLLLKPLLNRSITLKTYLRRIALTAAGWNNNTQTISISEVGANNTILVGAEIASQTEYRNCQVQCTTQISGSLTFTCVTVPTNDLIVNVTIFTDN